MRIPNVALSCVVYIGHTTASGGFKPRGTGFIGAVERSEGNSVFYLITADHVRRGLLNEKAFAIQMNNSQGRAAVLSRKNNLDSNESAILGLESETRFTLPGYSEKWRVTIESRRLCATVT